ncbi:MAG: fibronectin type III domain-containing protein, partial [Ekhidna sp.]|nr:fibronectin type III domain-containing protein [Ekhidna sp.]
WQYQQKEGSDPYGSWTDIAGSTAATVSYTVSGLTGGTAYAFRIRAVAGAVNGAPSLERTATPLAPAPLKPAGFSATAGNAVVTLTWTDPENGDITGWQYRQKEGSDAYGSWIPIGGSTAATVSHTVSGLTNGTVYTFRLRAVAGSVDGVASNEVMAAPADPAVTIMAGTSPVTEGTAAAFTVSAVPAPTADLTVKLTVAEAMGSDFVASSDEGMKTVTIPAASGSVNYTVATVNDDSDEPDGSVTVTIIEDSGYTVGSTASATVMINDDEEEAPLGADDAAEAVIFPNPSGRHLEVRSSIRGTFKILSLSGKSLLEGTANTRTDITSLKSGLYLVRLPDGRLLKFVRE